MPASRRLWLATDGSLADEILVIEPATVEQITAIHVALERFWRAVEAAIREPPDHAWRLAFETAVVEIATNIMRHAYSAGGADRGLSMRLRVYVDEAVALLSDTGTALAVMPDADGLAPGDPLDLPEGGYGLGLARACVDALEYHRTLDGTNCWRLVKRLNAPAART
jgi:anti-sigma regulatory factor (Ser/Thr protein kinase)